MKIEITNGQAATILIAIDRYLAETKQWKEDSYKKMVESHISDIRNQLLGDKNADH